MSRLDLPPPESVRRTCSCGAVLDLEDLPSVGHQVVPEDLSLCSCDPEIQVDDGGLRGIPIHSQRCESRGYELVLRNCPRCHTTITTMEPHR